MRNTAPMFDVLISSLGYCVEDIVLLKCWYNISKSLLLNL